MRYLPPSGQGKHAHLPISLVLSTGKEESPGAADRDHGLGQGTEVNTEEASTFLWSPVENVLCWPRAFDTPLPFYHTANIKSKTKPLRAVEQSIK